MRDRIEKHLRGDMEAKNSGNFLNYRMAILMKSPNNEGETAPTDTIHQCQEWVISHCAVGQRGPLETDHLGER